MRGPTLKKAVSLYGEPVKVEGVNTNNAWGFGGWYGKKYTFANGFTLRQGRISTRHRGTFPYSQLRGEINTVLSEN